MKTQLVHVIRALVCLFLAIAFGTSSAQDQNADIYGKWKIKQLAGAAEISALSQQQVDQLIGKSVLISPERFVFNGRTCMHPSYTRSTDDTATYFDREWRADAKELPLPKRVTIIETDCNTLYPIRPNHILVAERGNFFEAVRVGELPSQSNSAHHR